MLVAPNANSEHCDGHWPKVVPKVDFAVQLACEQMAYKLERDFQQPDSTCFAQLHSLVSEPFQDVLVIRPLTLTVDRCQYEYF